MTIIMMMGNKVNERNEKNAMVKGKDRKQKE